MQSNCVTPIYDNKGIFAGEGKIYYQYTDPLDGEMYVFPEMDVLHFKTSMTLDGLTGIPVRDMLGDVVEGASQSQQYMSNLYKGGMTASMALQYSGEIDESNYCKRSMISIFQARRMPERLCQYQQVCSYSH